jgi:transposase InsO family protein
VDFVNRWTEKTEIAMGRFTTWIGMPRGKFFDWRERYGRVNEHNAWVPRDHWLEDWEKRAIIGYWEQHPDVGYRALTFMMLDADVVAVSPSSVYRVLRGAGLLERWNRTPSKKGTGFVQPVRPHEHWHIDIAHLNLGGTFYYLCVVIDGYSRYVVGWDVRASMTEADVEMIVQKARERFPEARPRIISDNGPQFVAKDFKTFVREAQMTHVRTSPYYPQSNGKAEGCIKTWRGALRFVNPVEPEEAKAATAKILDYYNNKRPHSAIGYIAPKDKLHGREAEIFAARDRKLEVARARRAAARARRRAETAQQPNGNGCTEGKTATTTAPSLDSTCGAAVAGLRPLAYPGAALSGSD